MNVGSPLPASASPVDVSTSRTGSRLWTWTALVLALGVLREIVANLTGANSNLTRLSFIDLNAELSVPAWYGALLMLLGALLFWLTGRVEQSPRSAARWRLLSGIFVYLSIDEIVSVHEAAGLILTGIPLFRPLFPFAWVALAVPLLICLGIFLIPFMLRLPRRLAGGLILSGCIYVGGALAMEIFDALTRWPVGSWGRSLLIVLEEAGELGGLTILAGVLLRNLRDANPAIDLRFR